MRQPLGEMSRRVLFGFLIILSCGFTSGTRRVIEDYLRLPSGGLIEGSEKVNEDSDGTKWAVLIAGSNGYWNYRHQSDVCHAYQLLRKGGLKEENIVVFMYDDIAFDEENPRKGIIINRPEGSDVYAGVPKDYTGEEVTVNNLFAVILGNKSQLTGGSGKVVNSGPNDHIFIYYSDHGGPGVLGMPTNPFLYANDLVDVLKMKHASGTYKKMVFYLEACESGSIFEGLLPNDINIYATTAANAVESSWGTYCPGEEPSPPEEYETCLGDLYSVAWMEDSDVHNLQSETLIQQYRLVKKRTANENSGFGSHVMEYGNLELAEDYLYLYMGTNPANENSSFIDENRLWSHHGKTVNQRDADLIHFWAKYRNSPEGSLRKTEAGKQFLDAMTHRLHIDHSVQLIAKLLSAPANTTEALSAARPSGQPLVDDWNCLKAMVKTFEKHCGALSQYGMKHMRIMANLCNAGINIPQMADASSQACPQFPSGPWSSIHKGFSA